MKYKLFYLLVFTLCLSNLCNSQTQQLKFNKIEGSNEITLGKINALAKDGHGFMWFSDQDNRCIIRYDGSQMIRYQHDPKNPNSLGGYYPESLFIDASGIIWIGFYGEGIDRFDPATNTFTHYDHDPNDPSSLSSDMVSNIFVDHLNNIWIGTDDGLDLLNQKSGTFTHYKYDINDTTSLSCNSVRAIYEDRQGTLWVGTGFAFDNVDEGGLNRFERDTGTFTRFLHDPDDPHSLIADKVRAIFEDSKGNFWIGTNGDGLHSMDRKTGQFTRYTNDPARPDQLSSPPVNSTYSHITFITEDADENLWIGSESGGINRYDPVTKKTTHFGNDADNSGQFIDNSGWCILASPDGLVWLSTQETNLYKIDLYNINIPQIIENTFVSCFFQESASVLWIGTGKGLLRQNLKDGTTREFAHDPLNPNSLSDNNITKIIKDKQGIMWLGTESGLNRYDPTTDIITRYHHDPNDSSSLSNDYINDIVEDNDLNLWIGTLGGGLDRLDRDTGIFTHNSHNPADSNSLNWNFVRTIFNDETNNLWIGLDGNAGLDKLNKETGRITNYLRGLTILDIFKDSNGIIWVGTHQNGLYYYEMESDNFSPVIDQNKNININTAIISIIGDNQDNLWMGTLLGIYKLNQSRDNLILYGKENGVIGNILWFGGVSKLQDGKLLFGNFNGYYAFYPDKFKTPSGTSNIYFTDLWLNGKSVTPEINGVLKEPIISAKKIQLNHNQNTFAISATGIDYRHSGNKQLLYTLENYDEDWRTANVAEKMNYFKVPPGDYIFRFKSADNSTGEWLEKSIALIITPPWWKTWWAYSTYALMFIGGVFVVDRTQRRRLLAKAYADSREKELEQAKEIEKAYDELKATQSQLIQSEKMASLGELTAGIAHEIKNPLNFVNNFSEVNKELLVELNEAIQNGNFDEVKALAKDLTDNEEKIIFHGKRADAIVKGMLQHSRSSSGVKEPTDINALADEYLRLAYHGLRAKDKSFNAKFETAFDGKLAKVKVIPQDMGRVILNLITNAFYAVNERKKLDQKGYEPTVTVTTKKEGDKVLVSVTDNGNGIPKMVLDKIFQPFFTTKPTGQGTGLGLSMSYDIVQAHGGELKVETTEGKGTTFIIQLPTM